MPVRENRSGAFRDRAILRAPVRTQHPETGEQLTTYPADTAAVWAQYLPLRGREYLAAKEIHSELTCTVRIRYRSDVDLDWQLVCRGRTFNVQQIVDLMGTKEVLELMCSEIR